MIAERDVTFMEVVEQPDVESLYPLKRGEKFVGILPGRIIEVEDAFAKDQTSLEGADSMKTQMDEIMALPEEERHNAFCRLSSRLKQFSKEQGSYWDLDSLYTLDAADLPRKVKDDNPGVTNLWYRCIENARAVRERAAAAEVLIEDNILERASAHPNSPVEFFSIASGSARCGLNVIKRMKERGIQVRARFLDINTEALEYSIKLAKEMGLIDIGEDVKILDIDAEDENGKKTFAYKDSGKMLEFMHGNVVKINGVISSRPVDVAEAVGIEDYLPDGLTTNRFIPAIYRLLADGGVLIISNIVDNPEKDFLHGPVDWQKMFYRESEELAALLTHPRAGFLPENIKMHRIPNGIYRTAEARKQI